MWTFLRAFRPFCVRPKEVSSVFVGGKLFDAGLTYKLDDGRYWTVSKSQIRAMVMSAGLRKMRWMRDRFDCDDYARLLRVAMVLLWDVNAVGTVRTQQHVWNVAVCVDGLIYFEPQTGLEVQVGEGVYDMEGAMVSI